MEVHTLVFDHRLTLGWRAKLLRVARDWRQCDVAVRAGVSLSHVSDLERDLPVPSGVKGRLLRVLGLEGDGEQA